MKTWKRIVTLCLAAVLLLNLTACAGTAGTTEPAAPHTSAPVPEFAPQPSETEPTQSDSAVPYTVTDILGRKIEIPAEVTKIVGLGSAPRFLTYAGAADRLVGLSELEKSADPGMPYAYVNAELFAKCAAVSSGGSGDTYYTEELVVLNPDLIFLNTSDAGAADELQAQVNIPVIALYARDFLDSNFTASLRLIGSVMGTEDHAETVISAVEGWIQDLDDRTKDISEEDKPSVYTGAVGFRGPHGFEGTYGAYPPFVAIHAKNVVDETGEDGAMLIDLEKVTVWDPDIIFLNPSNMYIVNEDYKTNAAFYDNLSAVRNGKLYSQVSFNYFSTNMELAIADAYYAATVIYPEQFRDVNFEEKAEEIFRVMIGSEYLSVLDEAGIGFGSVAIGE